MSTEKPEEEKPKEWSDEVPATQTEQDICEKVRPQIKEKFQIFQAFAYRTTKLVGVGRWDIKVYVGDDKGVRLTVSCNISSSLDYKLDKMQYFTIQYELLK